MSKNLMERMEERNRILIDAVIRRIEQECPEAVAMIGICGSFCNGDIHERSDLDLMILIDDEKAWSIAECFVIGEVGFDFYCTTWDSLEDDAKCAAPYLAKLLDTKIIYCPKEKSMERFEALQKAARAVLDAPFCAEDLARAEGVYADAEKAFSKLMRAGDDLFESRWCAVEMLYHLENAVCVLNKTYFKLGVKRMFDEFAAMPNVPENFEQLVFALTDAKTPAEVQGAAVNLMRAADACFVKAKAGLPKEKKEKPTAENIRGTLEEMISNFRGKVWNAAQSGDTHAALSALGSLQSFFDDLHDDLDIPRYDALSGYDPTDLRRTAENYEAALTAYKAEYDRVGLPVNAFESAEAFAAHYISGK